MSIHSPLKLFVGGCGMITSCSVWLFDGQKPSLPKSMSLKTSSPDSIQLDRLPAVEKLSGWQGQAIEDQEVEASQHTDGTSSIVLKFKKDGNKQAILRPIEVDIGSFYVFADSTKKQYQEFDRSQIKIKLFKTPAWHSENKIEEYKDLEKTQIEELFKDNDEVRVKQLLLALHHKIEWLSFGSDSYNMYYMNRIHAEKLDYLKDLKIRHFNEFNRLKDYVKAKVSTCTTDEKACYPHPEEIDYLEMDRKEYFQNVWNSQSN